MGHVSLTCLPTTMNCPHCLRQCEKYEILKAGSASTVLLHYFVALTKIANLFTFELSSLKVFLPPLASEWDREQQVNLVKHICLKKTSFSASLVSLEPILKFVGEMHRYTERRRPLQNTWQKSICGELLYLLKPPGSVCYLNTITLPSTESTATL